MANLSSPIDRAPMRKAARGGRKRSRLSDIFDF